MKWAELTVHGWDEELPALLTARVPRSLARVAQCRPATIEARKKNLIGPSKPPLPFVALWLANASVPDTRSDAAAWSIADVDGVALSEFAQLRCLACGGAVPALYPEAGLPFFGSNYRRHPSSALLHLCGVF
ncbi:MAG: hypothetical protein J2P25_13780 [Nocardiopsaceae bacterium]|nr:hypothetical protein [Nocardiopsaceae bacterium]